MAYPTIYPTSTTIYDPEQCWSGYTIFQAKDVGAVLIDMNGRVAKLWDELHGFPNKILPGGQVMGSTGERNPKYGFQDQIDLVQVDWDGNITWKFDRYELVEDPDEKPTWMARQHHDFQRAGNPVGYYVPGMNPQVDSGNTLILSHKNVKNPKITDKMLLDDSILEVTWDGEIIWEWICSEHFDQMNFSQEALNIMNRYPGIRNMRVGDWMHINSMSTLRSNKWFDAGDQRFHPDNIIWDGRQTNITAITDKQSGKLVWQIGPDYDRGEYSSLGQIIGQHHAHMIPKGLPGEGNILIFDNGGWAGYGAPNPGAPMGFNNALRDYSRIIEFDPISYEMVWQYTPTEVDFKQPFDSARFYSPFISSVQRLPNGNSLITEGSGGRIFEVTPEHEIVWEYICPYWGKIMNINMVYRAYRVPYEWIPQLDLPEEVALPKMENTAFRVPGSVELPKPNATKVEGVRGYNLDSALCVLPDADAKSPN